MKRYLAKLEAHNAEQTTSPILHFEGPNDAELIFEVMKNCPNDFKILKKRLEYKFSIGKKYAIKNHKSALEMGHDISTLIDMDYDCRDRDFAIMKGSAERIPRIHSTKPACTLVTAIFIENGKFDQVTFFKAIRTIPELSSTDEETLNEIKKNAVGKTWERLKKGVFGKRRERLEREFEKKKIPPPLNDHSLFDAIQEKCINYNEDQIKIIIHNFFKENHSKIFELLTPVFSDFST